MKHCVVAVDAEANKITQNKYLMKNYTNLLYSSSQKLPAVFKLKSEKRSKHREVVVHISTNVSEKLAALIFRIFTLKTKPASPFETLIISIRPQVHKFSKNLEATSKFYTPAG